MHYLPTETAISTAFPWPGSVSAALCYANCRTLKKLWESGKWERKRDRWLNVLCAGESGCYCLCLSPTTSSGRLTTMLLRHVRWPKWHSRSFTANQIRQSKDALNKLLSHEKIQLYCQCRWSVTDRPFFLWLYLINTDLLALFPFVSLHFFCPCCQWGHCNQWISID